MDTAYSLLRKFLYYSGLILFYLFVVILWLIKLWWWLTLFSLALLAAGCFVIAFIVEFYKWFTGDAAKPRFHHMDFPKLPEKMKFKVPEELEKIKADKAEQLIKENEKIQEYLKTQQAEDIKKVVEKLNEINTKAWVDRALIDILDEEELQIIFFLLLIASGNEIRLAE